MLTLLVLCFVSGVADAPAAQLPEARPSEVGFDGEPLARIDSLVAEAIESRGVPGAVVLVARRGKIAFARAYGSRRLLPKPEPMTRDTIFDLASLTKPIATATSIMILLEQGKLRLQDTLASVLPEFTAAGKGQITIEQLLRHRAGLVADNPLADFTAGADAAWANLAKLELASPPGTRFVYSDVGFMILGRVVEKVSNRSLPEFARENIFTKLAMGETRFGLRPGENAEGWPFGRAAPTELVDGEYLAGIVHDPRARALGGAAGHAGLFSTADDLAVFAQMLLNEGVGANGARVLSPLAIRAMTDAGDTPARERRGLGWDLDTPFSSPRGDFFSRSSFGHTGFTGTSIWVDPATQTTVVVLTNRVHPDAKSASPTRLRARVANVVASAIVDEPIRMREDLAERRSPVLCGVDVLARDGFAGLRGKRVGLVTNHTGRDRDGRSTIDILFRAPGVSLVALFSPEHGLRGALDRPVEDGVDPATNLPVHSLYGKDRKPKPDTLRDVDALVYDIQDVGARFYTYISTLGLVLEAAKERGIPLFVLDRPNPIGGEVVDGPVRDAEFESFIAYHALPVRHGMTVGELARMFNAEREIGAELHVVACENWRRSDWFDRTGLTWVNPSPNMRSLTEALLYPGVCLLEATNLATGRGTDTPFERVGAPWIDPALFARALNDLDLPGASFVPVRFTPTERQFHGEDCGGVFIAVTDWARFNPLDLGIGMATVLRRLYREQWQPDGMVKMMADRATYEALLADKDRRELRAGWRSELAEFRKLRARYLIYRE